MQIQSIVHRKDKALSLYCICFILLILFISGCSEDYSSSYDDNDTGSYACSLKWPEDVPTLETASNISRAIDCSATGISTVRFSFYNGSGDYLTGDGFSCSLGRGTVSGIPAGNNIRLIVTGEDSAGNVIYWGERTGISIVAGQTTDDSDYPIPMDSSVPTNVSAIDGDGKVLISWDSVSGATSYNIYWSTSSSVTIATGTAILDVTSPYIHTGLTNGTTYYYVVTAAKENTSGESIESNEVNATPVHSWTLLNLPDTGQTTSYTDTWGEDSDYTINPPSYTDNDDGTVTDNVTSLMWQKEDDNTTRTWDDAITCCNDLTLAGYYDWRLPSAYELMSIVNCDTENPSIDIAYFPGTNASLYWSSTTNVPSSSSAWYVAFNYGNGISYYKSDSYYVRCVRAGQ